MTPLGGMFVQSKLTNHHHSRVPPQRERKPRLITRASHQAKIWDKLHGRGGGWQREEKWLVHRKVFAWKMGARKSFSIRGDNFKVFLEAGPKKPFKNHKILNARVVINVLKMEIRCLRARRCVTRILESGPKINELHSVFNLPPDPQNSPTK